jgi:Spy/CpxP family protein refolding chaperone
LPEVYVQDLTREIALTDDQRTAIVALLKAQETRLRDQQEQARQTFASEQRALHDRIAATLTPEQATAFRTWVERRTGPGRGR